jgi:hypothetical protein
MQLKSEEIKVSIETHTCTVVGTVHMPASAYRSRLSDLLNQKNIAFLSVTEASVYKGGKMDEPAYRTQYLAVNLKNIEVIHPLEGG